MRSLRSLLMVLIGLPLVLMVTLAAFLPFVSWQLTNDHDRRAWVAAWISVFTDGDVDLTGPVVARIFPKPELILSGARLEVDRHGVHTIVAVDGARLAASLDGLDLGWTLVLHQPDIRIGTGHSDDVPSGMVTARKVFEGLRIQPSLCAWMPGRLELDGGRISVGGFGVDLDRVVVDLASGENVLEVRGVERRSRRPLLARGRRASVDSDAVSGVVEFNLMGAEVDVGFTMRDLLGPGGVRGCWPGRLEAKVKVAADDPGEVWAATVRAVTPTGTSAPSDTPRARPAQPDHKAPRLTGGATLDIALRDGGGRPPVRIRDLRMRVDSVDLLSLNEPRVDVGTIGAAPPPGPTGDGEHLAAILREVEGRLRQLVSSVQRVHTWEAPVSGVADRLDAARRTIELTSPAELRIDRATLLGAQFTDATLRVGPPALAHPGICVGGAPLQLEIGARIGAWEAPLVMAATVDLTAPRTGSTASSARWASAWPAGGGDHRQARLPSLRQTQRHPRAAVALEIDGMLPRIDRVAARLRQPNEGALDASAFSHVFKLSASAISRLDNAGRDDEVLVIMRELRIDNLPCARAARTQGRRGVAHGRAGARRAGRRRDRPAELARHPSDQRPGAGTARAAHAAVGPLRAAARAAGGRDPVGLGGAAADEVRRRRPRARLARPAPRCQRPGARRHPAGVARWRAHGRRRARLHAARRAGDQPRWLPRHRYARAAARGRVGRGCRAADGRRAVGAFPDAQPRQRPVRHADPRRATPAATSRRN